MNPIVEGYSGLPSGLSSPRHRSRSRNPSFSSDQPSSATAHGFMSPPASVSPEAAFIAAAAASQIITNDHDSRADTWYDQQGLEPSGEVAVISPAALQLVNSFLDQLLLNVLGLARATTLSALRPAVTEILKPKLAKDAMNQADEELTEYLGGVDEAEEGDAPEKDEDGISLIRHRDWDLELVWKRTRLRCMVYSSLGDLEEDDEDYFMERDGLGSGSDAGTDSCGGCGDGSEAISPAAAIFLTSILEFMAEQALIVAGQAAYQRLRSRLERELRDGIKSPGDAADRVVVKELDMERVALDRTLGRLWRGWKKRIRAPGPDLTPLRSFSRASGRRHSTAGIVVATAETAARPPKPTDDGLGRRHSSSSAQLSPALERRPSDIPLPISERDVEEIEMPGLVAYSDDEADADHEGEDGMARAGAKPLKIRRALRPRSLMISRPGGGDLPIPSPAKPPLTPSPPRSWRWSTSLPESGNLPDALHVNHPYHAYPTVTHLREALPVNADQDRLVPISDRRPLRTATPFSAANLAAGGDADDDYSTEEPEILISERVSLGGRSESPETSENGGGGAISGRRASVPRPFIHRSSSVHSARIVEVGHKSPILSRRSSSEMLLLDRMRPASVQGARGPPTSLLADVTATTTAAAAMAMTTAPLGIHSSAMAVRSPVPWPPPTPVITEVEEDAGTAPGGRTPTSAGLPTPASVELPTPVELPAVAKAMTMIRDESVSPSSSPRPAPPDEGDSPTIRQTAKVSATPIPFPKQHPQHQRAQLSPIQVPTELSAGPAQQQQPIRHASPLQSHPLNFSPSSPASPPLATRSNIRRTPSPPKDSFGGPETIGVLSVISQQQQHQQQQHHQQQHQQQPQQQQQQQLRPGSSGRIKPQSVRNQDDNVSMRSARTFEQLIRSDETLQYTLTPENMRDDESRSINNNSPVISLKGRRSEDSRLHNAMALPAAAAPRSRSNSAANSIMQATVAPSIVRRAGSVSAGSLARGRGMASLFSHPLRQNPPPVAPAQPGLRKRGDSATKMRLQAREAAVDGREDNSVLIDFIRRGPPGPTDSPRIPRTVAPFRNTMDSDQMASGGGGGGGMAVDAHLPDMTARLSQTTAMTAATDMSAISSNNSQSGLLLRKATPGTAPPLGPAGGKYTGAGTFFDGGEMKIERKQRRVRDPYAIDLSDEDEEDEDEDSDMIREGSAPAGPRNGDVDEDDELDELHGANNGRRPVRGEESLADFLRNCEPPAPVPAQRAATDLAAPKSKRKGSGASLIGRFTRSSSFATRPFESRSLSSRAGTIASSLRVGGGGGGGGHMPIQLTMPPGYDAYGPIGGRSDNLQSQSHSHYGHHILSHRPATSTAPPPSAGRAAVPPMMRKFEPRDAVSSGGSRTSDLAAFLRSSSPPPEPAAAAGLAQEAGASSGGGGFARVFGRRKRSAV